MAKFTPGVAAPAGGLFAHLQGRWSDFGAKNMLIGKLKWFKLC